MHKDLCDGILFNNATPLIFLLPVFSTNYFLSRIFYQSFFMLKAVFFNEILDAFYRFRNA